MMLSFVGDFMGLIPIPPEVKNIYIYINFPINGDFFSDLVYILMKQKISKYWFL